MKKSIIVATNSNNTIGNNGKIPWHNPLDLKHFRDLTTGHHILMGRNTFESIGKPLPNRTNIVISRDTDFHPEGCIVFKNIEDAASFAFEQNQKELFIIGGEQIYRQSLPTVDAIYQTLVLTSDEGDTHFPELDENEWNEISREEHLDLNPPIIFRTLERK